MYFRSSYIITGTFGAILALQVAKGKPQPAPADRCAENHEKGKQDFETCAVGGVGRIVVTNAPHIF